MDTPRLLLSFTDIETPVRYVGSMSGELIDLEEGAPVRIEGEIDYDLSVERIGSEILVRGAVSVPVAYSCARCSDFFSTKLEELSFLRSFNGAQVPEEVNIAPDIREDLVLNIPGIARCADAHRDACERYKEIQEKMKTTEDPVQPEQQTWAALDKLDLTDEE